MAENSKIEWTTHTFNPWVGCSKVSPGCDHCYAESWAKRAGEPGLWAHERRRTSSANWAMPKRWNKAAAAAGRRHRVFCASLADVFDNEVPDQWRADLFSLIKATPNLDWLLLTKRIGNAARMLPHPWYSADWSNVWIGATVVNQEEVNRDVPKLLALPAAIRFLSVEPMLGPIDLCGIFGMSWNETMKAWVGPASGFNRRGIDGRSGIDWVIVGGESGSHARPMQQEWVERIRFQCEVGRAKFFMKQGSAANWPKFKSFESFPSELQVREFPEVWGQ